MADYHGTEDLRKRRRYEDTEESDDQPERKRQATEAGYGAEMRNYGSTRGSTHSAAQTPRRTLALKSSWKGRPQTWFKRKLESRVREGRHQWREYPGAIWEDTVTLDSIRRVYINEQARLGTDAFPDPCGCGGPDDVSAFHPVYANHGPLRENRPDILFQFKADDSSRPKYDPGLMRYQGRLVLDPEDKPIRDFHEIPKCLSSDTPGAKLEWIMRRNLDIEHADIRARFPRQLFLKKKGQNQSQWHSLPHANSCVNMPMVRYRNTSGSICWKTRADISAFQQAMEAYIRPINNSTRHWRRDLEICETDFIKWACGNTGRFEKRGKRHHLRREERERNMAKLEERMTGGLIKLGVIHEEEKLHDAAMRMGLSHAGSDADVDDDSSADGEYEDEYYFDAAHVDEVTKDENDVLVEGEEEESQHRIRPAMTMPLSPSQISANPTLRNSFLIPGETVPPRDAAEEAALPIVSERHSVQASRKGKLDQKASEDMLEEEVRRQRSRGSNLSTWTEYAQVTKRRRMDDWLPYPSQKIIASRIDDNGHVQANTPRQADIPQWTANSRLPQRGVAFDDVATVDPSSLMKNTISWYKSPEEKEEDSFEHVELGGQNVDQTATNAAARFQASNVMQGISGPGGPMNIRELHRQCQTIISDTYDRDHLRKVIIRARAPSTTTMIDAEMDQTLDTLLGKSSAAFQPRNTTRLAKSKVDVRTIAPSHLGEEICLEKALEFTRHEFVTCFGRHAPPTDSSKCYNEQHSQLVADFEKEWYRLVPLTLAPKLHKFPEWNGAISLWPFEGLGLLWREW